MVTRAWVLARKHAPCKAVGPLFHTQMRCSQEAVPLEGVLCAGPCSDPKDPGPQQQLRDHVQLRRKHISLATLAARHLLAY